MKTNNGFVVPVLLGIIVLLLVGGIVYVYKNEKAEAPVVVDTNIENNVISEPEILVSLKTNWQTIQAFISFRPNHPGTTAWLSPYSVQFIGNNNLLVNFEDGYNPGIAVLNFTDNQFKILETFKDKGEFTLVEWQNLVKKYGDASYPVSTYTVSLLRNNEIVSFQDLTKVPENIFVKDYFVTPPIKIEKPTVTVISPNGGEAWNRGSNQLIKFSVDPSKDKNTFFDVFLINSNGYVYTVGLSVGAPNSVACVTLEGVECPTPKTFSEFFYYWLKIPNTIEKILLADGKYKIKVCLFNTSNCDESNNYFSITTSDTY